MIDTEINLREKAEFVRNDVISVAVKNGAGHIAPSLSCVDILVALFYEVMAYDAANPLWEERDRLIFSKSHGCYALYSILSDLEIIPAEQWKNFYTPKSSLKGCTERCLSYGFEAGCGSLGHGLPMAVGLAFGAKLQRKSYRVFCLMGDGEMQEGTTWEAVQFGVKHDLDNLTIIVDKNNLQAMDFTVGILDTTRDALINRVQGFGIKPLICPGHDIPKLVEYLHNDTISENSGPRMIIAETIKGYGLKCMENVPKFHFRVPTAEEMESDG